MDRTREFLASLNDPSQYVRVPSVAVFDEHEESYWEDQHGKPVPPGTAKARKKTRRFSRQDLERIAARCNARLKHGDPSPIVLGHTDPDEPDETKQPPIVGYACNFRVGYDSSRRRHMLYADYHFRKDRYGEAREYPRTSVELWPDDMVIDPVAILKRTPQRDLGQWIYSMSGRGADNRQSKTVLRYSMASATPRGSSMEENELLDEPMVDEESDAYAADEEPTDEPMDDAGDELSHGEKLEQWARHCFSHPHARHFAKHYGADEAAALMDEGPIGAPDAMDEPASYGAVPSGSNAGPAGVPASGGKSPSSGGPASYGAGSGGSGGPTGTSSTGSKAGSSGGPGAYRRDGQSIRFARMERELAALRREKERAAQEANLAESRRIVSQLIYEGYDLDEKAEVLRFAKVPASRRDGVANYIRKHYKRAPVGGVDGFTGMVPVSRDEPGPAHGGMTPTQLERAVQYSRERGSSWEEAVAATRGN